MNWDAVGAIGEVVGAAAVVVTLMILVLQVRQNTQSLEESNKLNRSATVDRHADTVSRWRGRITENPDLSELWVAAIQDQELDRVQLFRLNNLWIDFVNTQRSNYVRAMVVGELGLAKQAVRSVAVETMQSPLFKELWETTRPWHKLSSPEFVGAVDSELEDMTEAERDEFKASSIADIPHSMRSIDEKPENSRSSNEKT